VNNFDVDGPSRAELQEIGHELHDGPIQAVVSVVLELDGFRQRVNRDPSIDAAELTQTLERSRRVLQDAVEDLRIVVRRLGPPPLAPSGAGRSDLVPDPGSTRDVAWSEASEVSP
jgi:signal transduction histidine kinase